MKINLVLWGLGRHSITKLIPAIKKSKKINLYGLFTRDKKVLRQQSKKLSCKIWNNQKLMLLDNKIDVVYLATPTGLHYKQGKEILKSGKNLWSEKSLANNYKQVKDLVKIAKKNNLSICEAFMHLYHPIFEKIKNLINKKHIGNIVSVNLNFYCPHMKKSDWRYKKKLGGGALLDLGCYTISTYLNLFKTNSKLFYVNLKKNKNFSVDTAGSAVFINKNILYNLNWGFGYLYKNYIRIIGSKGTIVSEPFFSKPISLTPYIKIYKNKKSNKILFSKTNHFLNMLNCFSDTIKNKNKINNHLKQCLIQSKLINKLRIKNDRKKF